MKRICKCANTSAHGIEKKPSENVDLSGLNRVSADIGICCYNPPPILLLNELLQEIQEYQISDTSDIQTLHLLS